MAFTDTFTGEQEMSRSELGGSRFSGHDEFLRKGRWGPGSKLQKKTKSRQVNMKQNIVRPADHAMAHSINCLTL
jgi:hypothetical protein